MEKLYIILEHFRKFPDGTDDRTFQRRWQHASENKIHQTFSDERISQMKQECGIDEIDSDQVIASLTAINTSLLREAKKTIEAKNYATGTSSIEEVD